MAESYLKFKKQLPCLHILMANTTKGLYVGVPVIIGSRGVEKVVELELNKEEKNNFENSIKSVQDLFEAAKKIDPSLN